LKGEEHVKRSLIATTCFLAALLGSDALIAAHEARTSRVTAPGKASSCAGKNAAGKDCGCGKQGACESKGGCCGAKDGCGGKMGMSPDMAAKMAEADKRMDALAAKMNAASGDAKVEAMAALLNEIVARHKTMHETMHARHEAMCGGGAKTQEKCEEKSEGGLLGEHEHGK
jgi:hypothetical protein